MPMNSAEGRSGGDYLTKSLPIRLTEDVRFGVAGVEWSAETGPGRFRELLLDIYEPAERSRELRPALILAFGGAFQRGSRKDDVVGEPPHRNSAIAEYCNEFARRGYVCFSIDYRLMPERPDPGVTPTLPPGTTLNIDRANFVRNLLGLGPCTQQTMADEIEAATDDVSAAVGFVRARAHAFGIDPSRIAVGGFSAGATVAINAAYVERAPVAAVVALSGRLSLASAKAYLSGPGEPPVLMVFGENDLPGMLEDMDTRAAYLASINFKNQVAHIPGATHFYPRTSIVTDSDGSKRDVESVMARFLYKNLKLGEL
jgi:acetyl esterase/lipase